MEDSALFQPLMKKKSKFVIGDETKTTATMSLLPAGMTNSNSNSATPTPAPAANSGGGGGRRASVHRRQVKRQSLGHVRIRPLAGKHAVNNSSLTDTEADEDKVGGVRSTLLRRSQSQRSLRHMDMLQPSMPMTRPKEPVPVPAPALTPTRISSSSSSSVPSTISKSSSRVGSTCSLSPLPLPTTPSVIAEPIEQPLHVVAHNLVVPETRGSAYLAAQEVACMSTSPRSTTVTTPMPGTNAATAACRNAFRSQFITRQQDSSSDPIELIDKEYAYIRQYQSPMAESLIRCVLKKRRVAAPHTLPTSAILNTPQPLHQPRTQALQKRRQLLQQQQQQQQQQKLLSTSASSSSLLQYQHPTAPWPSFSNTTNSSGILGIRWGAAAGSLWERMVHGV